MFYLAIKRIFHQLKLKLYNFFLSTKVFKIFLDKHNFKSNETKVTAAKLETSKNLFYAIRAILQFTTKL